MNNQDALNIVTQAIDVAVQKGAYTLQDVANILQALQILKTKDEISGDIQD